MKINSSRYTMIFFAFSLIALSFFSANSKIIPESFAYTQFSCDGWAPNILTWEENGLSSTNISNIKEVISNYNQLQIDMYFIEKSSGADVEFTTYNDIFDDARGFTSPNPSIGCNPEINGTFEISLNEGAHTLSSNQKKQATWSHEVGHLLGLNHPTETGTNADAANMRPTATSYDSHGIFVPVLDDIRGFQDLYGQPDSTPQCTNYNSNGSIDYTGTCSSESSALPMTEKITTSGTSFRAFANDTPQGNTMPDSNSLLMTTKVEPNILYRFSMGIHSNTDISDGSSRYATAEIDNSGIFAAWTNPVGTTSTSTISSTTPSTSSTYFLEIISQENDDTTVYAYIDDSTGTNAPTFLGSAKFLPSLSWSGTKYFGTGVWTDSGSNPASNYDVTEYYNLMTCLPTSSDWTVNYDCTLPKDSVVVGNMTVENNYDFIIPSGSELDIDFQTNHLLVKDGSSVTIKNGGKLD